MKYCSNLRQPDVRVVMDSRVRPWSYNHDVPSDPTFEPENCFMTHDEAAILHHCANSSPGTWIDIGSRFGWTSIHIAVPAGCLCLSVDPIYSEPDKMERYAENMQLNRLDSRFCRPFNLTSDDFFKYFDFKDKKVSGVCIDGNHDSPFPLRDAINASSVLDVDGIIVFHDFWGKPIRDGAEHLMDNGYKCRVYSTPNGMAACWRGKNEPPMHRPDPAVDWGKVRRNRAADFPFERCC